MNKETNELLFATLNDPKLLNKLNEVLEEKNSTINISLDDKNVIKIEEKEIQGKNIQKNVFKTKGEDTSLFLKVIKSSYKIFESFFDSIAKNFLKKKYKINNSVYNDGKKAVVAICSKDTKTFLKKVTDSVLNLFKKIPSDTRKIIKNTKNVAIDEIYSWKV